MFDIQANFLIISTIELYVKISMNVNWLSYLSKNGHNR